MINPIKPLIGTFCLLALATLGGVVFSTARANGTQDVIFKADFERSEFLAAYFVEWGVYARNYHVKNIDTSGAADKLTHIIYSFGNVQNGRCTMGDNYAATDKYYDAASSVDGIADLWDTGALRGNFNQLKKLKQMHPHIKIVWSFGGWTWSGGFSQAMQDLDTFVDSCHDLVYDPRWDGVFDGIDIDWEYPNECGLTCDTSGYNGYRDMMQALRVRFGNDLIISAIGAGASKLAAANYGEASAYVDYYMVMTYDYFGAWSSTGPTAPHSPLQSYTGIPEATNYSAYALEYLINQNVNPNKLALGIGFYGRGWNGVNQASPGGSAKGAAAGEYEQGINDYSVLKSACPATGVVGGTAYAHCGDQWWSYDTPATIATKLQYMKQTYGVSGTFAWELSGDTVDAELLSAMKNAQ